MAASAPLSEWPTRILKAITGHSSSAEEGECIERQIEELGKVE
jgi:hypothetical protein